MRRQRGARRLGWFVIAAVACGALLAAACQPAASPAKPAAPAPAAAPAKPAAEPAKSATQPAKPAASEEPDAALVEAAKKEGKLTWYTAMELTLAKKLAELFEKKYGLPVEVNRSGSERIFAQFMKEQASNIRKADVIDTADASNFVTMRSSDLIVAYRPKGADAFAAELKGSTLGPDNFWLGQRLYPVVIVYNTNKLKEGEAPKGWKDLVDAKWKGKLTHGHPGYSGMILTTIYQLQKEFGDGFYRQLAKNEPLIVQSTIDVAAKVAGGERDVGAGTPNYVAFSSVRKGDPMKIVYPADGTALIASPQALAKAAPHPNAAKLFQEFIFSRDVQQFMATEGGVHSARGDVKLPEGQVDLTKLKLFHADAGAIEKARDAIQKMFKDAFGV